MVVLPSLWPSSSWMVRMSWPRSSRCVSNEWRKVWQLAAFVTPGSPLHRLLHHARIEMVAALGAGFPVAPAVPLGEDPLPRPFTLRDRILLRAIEMGGSTARPMAGHEARWQ